MSGIGPGELLALVDHHGEATDLIRSLELDIGIVYVSHTQKLGKVEPGTLVMLAVYSGEELDRGYPLYCGLPTVVLGMGTGPREGSRALQLGAVGYVHDDQTPTALRAGIGDAHMRAYRRWRSAASS